MASSDSRTPEQIEADLTAVRNRLTNSIEGLIDQVHPTKIKQRTVRGVKTLVSDEFAAAKAQVIDEQGRPRTTRLLIGGGALAGLVTLVLVISRISARRAAAKPQVGVRIKH